MINLAPESILRIISRSSAVGVGVTLSICSKPTCKTHQEQQNERYTCPHLNLSLTGFDFIYDSENISTDVNLAQCLPNLITLADIYVFNPKSIETSKRF